MFHDTFGLHRWTKRERQVGIGILACLGLSLILYYLSLLFAPAGTIESVSAHPIISSLIRLFWFTAIGLMIAQGYGLILEGKKKLGLLFLAGVLIAIVCSGELGYNQSIWQLRTVLIGTFPLICWEAAFFMGTRCEPTDLTVSLIWGLLYHIALYMAVCLLTITLVPYETFEREPFLTIYLLLVGEWCWQCVLTRVRRSRPRLAASRVFTLRLASLLVCLILGVWLISRAIRVQEIAQSLGVGTAVMDEAGEPVNWLASRISLLQDFWQKSGTMDAYRIGLILHGNPAAGVPYVLGPVAGVLYIVAQIAAVIALWWLEFSTRRSGDSGEVRIPDLLNAVCGAWCLRLLMGLPLELILNLTSSLGSLAVVCRYDLILAMITFLALCRRESD